MDYYYCPNHVAEHIDTHAAHLGFTKDSLAIYYFLLAVEDYEFPGKPWINNDITMILNKLNKRLKRQLEDMEEYGRENKVDLDDIE